MSLRIMSKQASNSNVTVSYLFSPVEKCPGLRSVLCSSSAIPWPACLGSILQKSFCVCFEKIRELCLAFDHRRGSILFNKRPLPLAAALVRLIFALRESEFTEHPFIVVYLTRLMTAEIRRDGIALGVRCGSSPTQATGGEPSQFFDGHLWSLTT